VVGGGPAGLAAAYRLTVAPDVTVHLIERAPQLGGLAAGFLVGMALPSTRVEDERIGPVSDEIKDRARESGQEALDRGKQVAQDVAETAKDSAQDVVDTARDSGAQQAQELRSS